jgi:dihydroorotate dehydrogenase
MSKNLNSGNKVACLGLNIGKNALTPIERATDDYLIGLSGVYAHADYITVNISSPNTKNLRSLQTDEALDQLLSALNERKKALAEHCIKNKFLCFSKLPPIWTMIKLRSSPHSLRKARHRWRDCNQYHTCQAMAVQGMAHANETGGLSGAPVLAGSNRVIRLLRNHLGPRFSNHWCRRHHEWLQTVLAKLRRVPMSYKSIPA